MYTDIDIGDPTTTFYAECVEGTFANHQQEIHRAQFYVHVTVHRDESL